MSIDKNFEKFLETQGFEREYDGYLLLALNRGSDRHQTEVWIERGLFNFRRENTIGLNYYLNESDILKNLDEDFTHAKNHWLSVKKNLLDMGFEVRVADKFTGLEVQK